LVGLLDFFESPGSFITVERTPPIMGERANFPLPIIAMAAVREMNRSAMTLLVVIDKIRIGH
jgi:hypothetical protein